MGTLEAWRNMREVCVVGVGMHKFMKPEGNSVTVMGREAILAALDDAGADFKDIEAGFCGRVNAITGTGQAVFGEIGQTGILIDNVEKACASASTALRIATWVIAAGLYDVCLCAGVEVMFRGLLGAPMSESTASYAQLLGMGIMPGEYALRARRHMSAYGSTPEQFAQVSVKSHKNSAMNPYARYQTPMSLEEVLNSRMIADPVTLYQCSNNSDGATAVVVCAKEIAHRFRGKPITVAGWASGTPEYSPVGVGGDVAEGFIARLGQEAYERAGAGPGDIKVCQVHDAFAPGEVFAVEELDFCPLGEGARFIWEGNADIGGKVGVNTDGGLLGRGHPIGATGLAQIIEIVHQLRGDAGPRQIPNDPKVGMTHNVGVGGCNVFILSR